MATLPLRMVYTIIRAQIKLLYLTVHYYEGPAVDCNTACTEY